jgi:rSAM/selenodomain-associated transferase 1
MDMERHLIVYAKQPSPGHAKTRLGAAIGDQQAAGVYARLLYTYLLQLLQADLADIAVELSAASPSDVPYFAAAFPEFTVHSQIEGDLGQRMAASFEGAFAAGADSVVLTGSDIPQLDTRTIRAAFRALESTPVVIGPARDGGYYLIGMRAPGAPLFEGVEWSSERTLAQTEALARSLNLAISYLPEQGDLDTQEDFERWHTNLINGPTRPWST